MNPPRWAEALLRAALPARDRETISGDLLEEYREQAMPEWRARLWYLRQVASLLNLASLWNLGLDPAVLAPALVWAATAGVVEYVLLFAGPFDPALRALAFGSVVLCAAAATAVRTGKDWRLLVRASSCWGFLFALAMAAALAQTMFRPGPLVALAMVIFPAAGFHAAAQTRLLRMGVAASAVTGVMVSLMTAAVILARVHIPHPPLSTVPMIAGISTILGMVGAAFGKNFGSRTFGVL